MSEETPKGKSQLSKDATPFIPSFMRNAALTPNATGASPPSMTPASEPVSGSNDDDAAAGRETPLANWGQFIAGMQEVEVEMLIDMMPAEVQMTYNEALHRANKAATHRNDEASSATESVANKDVHYQDAPNATERRRRAVEAATSTFNELSADQLFFLEEFLHDDADGRDTAGMSGQLRSLEALLGAAGDAGGDDRCDGDWFGNGEEDMNSEEEEWLLEQMMGPSLAKPSGKTTAGTQKQTKRSKRAKK